MRRILVSGLPGVGKTTLARHIEQRLGVRRHELDLLHHGPGWTKRPSFEADVAAWADDPTWVTEDQYHSLLGTLLWERADTVVWLDLERPIVMRRVVRRSLLRAALRTELYNGNREQWRHLLDADHPIRWSWSNHRMRRARTELLTAAHPDVRVVRLRTPRHVDAWLAELGT